MDSHEPVFGGELRKCRESAGHSLATFAKLIHYSKGYLSKVETGRAAGNRELAQACDAALGADGALLALMQDNPSRHTGSRAVTAVTGLPRSTRHFIGRAEERDVVVEVLNGTRSEGLCVLSGMPGAGKTALALRGAWDVAALFPDGCLYLDLGGHAAGGSRTTAHDVLDPLLRLLGVPGDQIPPQTDARANLYRGRLRGKRLLLVLDNVADSSQVSALVPSEPRCRVVITSRSRLNSLDDAVRVEVGVLSEGEAATLFRAVAGERADLAPQEVIARIARLCGRLPLAICIAASRFRAGVNPSSADFERRLADQSARLGVLDDGERSVAAAFALSHRELRPDQAEVFALLGMHPGRSAGIDEVAALAGIDPERATGLLDRLGDVHLVDHTENGEVRLHDLLRDFARALPPATDHDAALRRLTDHNLFLAESSDELIAPHRYRMRLDFPDLPTFSAKLLDRESALTWLDSRWRSLAGLCVLAAARGLHSRSWQLAFLLREYFFRTKLWDPWIETHLTAAASARAAGDDRALAMTLNNLGMAHADRGELAAAVGYYEEALELYRDAEDEHGETTTISNVAWTALYLGDHERAWRDLRTAQATYERQHNPRNAAIALRGISLAETELGRYDDAALHADESYARFRELDLPLDMVMSLNSSAWAHFRAGRHELALERYELAEASADSCSAYEQARAYTGVGNVHAASGRTTEAEAAWARADELHPHLAPAMVGEARVRAAG